MQVWLIILCIGTTSPAPVKIEFKDAVVCQVKASEVRGWKTMLYRCEANCLSTDLDVEKK